jgi:hypothetical protein
VGKVEEGGVFVLVLGLDLGLLPPFFFPAFRAIGGAAAVEGPAARVEEPRRVLVGREQVLTDTLRWFPSQFHGDFTLL